MSTPTEHVRVYDDPDALAEAAGMQVEEWIGADVAAAGRCRIALAGGSTPLALYRWLATHSQVEPGAFELWYGDERCVPPDHVDSNHRAAHEALIAPLGIPEANVHAIDGGDPDHVAAAERYAACMPERFDLVLLGMGPDGHTASLFPGDRAALEERERRALHVVGPKPPPNRITLTPPVFEVARRVLLLAAGSGKASAVARALDPETDVVDVPAALVREREWMLDRAAAAELDL